MVHASWHRRCCMGGLYSRFITLPAGAVRDRSGHESVSFCTPRYSLTDLFARLRSYHYIGCGVVCRDFLGGIGSQVVHWTGQNH